MEVLKRLVDDRATAWEKMKAITDKAASEENRSLTGEEEQEWQRLETELNDIDKRIDRCEKEMAHERRNAELREQAEALPEPDSNLDQNTDSNRDDNNAIGRDEPYDGRNVRAPLEQRFRYYNRSEGPVPETGYRSIGYHRSFINYLRRGEGISVEDRNALFEQRALQVDSDTGGGFFSSERFISGLLQAVDDILVISQLASHFPCRYDETLGAPKLDGDISDFDFESGELTESEDEDGPTFGMREFKPRPLKRKTIKISKRLLENPRINVENIVYDRVKVSLARSLDKKYMFGSGANEPLGLFTPSDLGIPTTQDVTTSSTTFLNGDDLIDAQDTLKQGYRGVWLFHRNSITKIRKLKDGDGNYLWRPGLEMGEPNKILGDRYIIGDNVPNDYGAASYIGMYADFSYYWIADALSLTVQRLLELYARKGQIGLLFDKMAVDAMPVMEEAFVRIKTSS